MRITFGRFQKPFHFSDRILSLTIKPEYAFGAKGNEAFIIPPDATVEYIVTLHDFEKEPESWKLNPEESLVQAKIVKDKATNFLKQEKYQLAIKLYEKSNKFLSNCSKFLFVVRFDFTFSYNIHFDFLQRTKNRKK